MSNAHSVSLHITYVALTFISLEFRKAFEYTNRNGRNYGIQSLFFVNILVNKINFISECYLIQEWSVLFYPPNEINRVELNTIQVVIDKMESASLVLAKVICYHHWWEEFYSLDCFCILAVSCGIMVHLCGIYLFVSTSLNPYLFALQSKHVICFFSYQLYHPMSYLSYCLESKVQYLLFSKYIYIIKMCLKTLYSNWHAEN